jgi:hypothetical protein
MKTIQIGNIDPQKHIIVDKDIWESLLRASHSALMVLSSDEIYSENRETYQMLDTALNLAKGK